MTITYKDIKHRIRPLDCSEIEDLRGGYVYKKYIINYENTDFTGCVLYYCYPSGINGAIEVNTAKSIEDVTLIRANLENARLNGANLENANLENANLEGASLKKANLKSANFQGANMDDAGIRSANLENANLENASLMYSNLKMANLRGANLRGADLRGAAFKQAKYNDKTIFPNTITESQKSSMKHVKD
jgi:uncharacterized protein YjbI with pentapeptide repeats